MYNFGMQNQMQPNMFSYDVPPRFQQNQNQNSLIRVTGIDGAKAYQMFPNSTVALFDSSEDLFYVKSTDDAGFPTIRTFSFKEETGSESPQTTTDYVSRDELDAFKQEVEDYVKQFISKSSKSTKQSNSVITISE